MMLTKKITVLYRGSLKSCNYHCGYCPFSKRKGSLRELDRDKDQWFRFVESVLKGNALEAEGEDSRPLTGAVMVVPYGEALIHSWYWQGLGRLGAGSALDFVGAQTNLSFSVEQSAEEYKRAGGLTGKLRLWATFHPDMVSVDEFVRQCRRVRDSGISMCAGTVGVPENLKIIRCLRQRLPSDIYLWINKMDGLGRPYTKEEIREFEAIDPFFIRELAAAEPDIRQCRDRLFVEAAGTVRRCNISPVLRGNWYGRPEDQDYWTQSWCGRKRCSCYLAYGGRQDPVSQVFFGSYPVFRIPRTVKGAFLDIEGTLIPEGEKEIPRFTRTGLELAASMRVKLFFATTLPVREARRRCQKVWSLFVGGVFAGGAHVAYWEKGGQEKESREIFSPLDRQWIPVLREEARRRKARVLVYESQGIVYKVTLTRPVRRPWKEEELQELRQSHGEDQVRFWTEGNCLQAAASKATKANGVRTLCCLANIPVEETAAAGDSKEDQEMMKMCGYWQK